MWFVLLVFEGFTLGFPCWGDLPSFLRTFLPWYVRTGSEFRSEHRSLLSLVLLMKVTSR